MADFSKRGFSGDVASLQREVEAALGRVRSDVDGNASYTPANPALWDGAPTTVKEALDRLAAAVESGTSGPIA